MKPSSFNNLAISVFIFELGSSTETFSAIFALRILVNISAIGSDTIIIIPVSFLLKKAFQEELKALLLHHLLLPMLQM